MDPAKRATILDGAARVFLEKGFDAAGVNDICRAAGVSKSTLYVYFDTKETLFSTLVEHERERLFAGVDIDITARDFFDRSGCWRCPYLCHIITMTHHTLRMKVV